MPDAKSPYDPQTLTLSQAAPLVGLTADYLRAAAIRGQLAAYKVGRNWVTTLADVRAFQSREPATPQGRGQRRRWTIDKSLDIVQDQLLSPAGEHDIPIADEMLEAVAQRAATRWMVGRGVLSEGTGSTEHSNWPFKTPGSRLRSLTASRYYPRIKRFAQEMGEAPEQDLELLIKCSGEDFVVMTRRHFDHYMSVVTVQAHREKADGEIEQFEETLALIDTVGVQSTFYIVYTDRDQSAAVELVSVPESIYARLRLALSWELLQRLRRRPK